MQKLMAFFRLIRSGNLLIMALTLAMSFFCMTDYLLLEDLITFRFLFLLLTTLCAAAAGYIINDYHDVKLDMVNKPAEVIIGNMISRRWAMMLYGCINALAIFFALLIGKDVALAVLICIAMLWLYSTRYKKSFLTGNILVGLLSAFVVLIVLLFNPNTPFLPIVCYAAFAFMISLIREIIKDVEDMQGDSRYNSKTVPIVLGIRRTKLILQYLNACLIFFIAVYLIRFLPELHFSHTNMRLIYLTYMFTLVLIPQYILAFKLKRADVKEDFSKLSKLCKLTMLTGMVSMVLFKV